MRKNSEFFWSIASLFDDALIRLSSGGCFVASIYFDALHSLRVGLGEEASPAIVVLIAFIFFIV